MIYFDNAATTSPKPKQVLQAVTNALTKLSANPGRSGHAMSEAAAVTVYTARQKAAALFGAPSAESVIFTQNCTASINYVLKGLLRPRDRVLISSLEHNAIVRPLTALKSHMINYDVFEVDFSDKEVTLRSFLNTVRPDTRLVICTHASNVTGTVLPITEIGKYCRENGILFAVDAAQSAGVIDIDMERDCIDYLCIAPHKGLYAPMGTGILIIAGQPPVQLFEGGTGTESVNLSQPSEAPERYESGTVNLPGIAGISAGIDFINSKGIIRIHTHETNILKQIYRGLSGISGIRLYTPEPSLECAPVLSFNLKDEHSVEIANRLSKRDIAVRAGLHCAPFAHKRLGTIQSGTVRIAPSAFTSQADADRMIEAVKMISKGAKSIFFNPHAL